MHGVQLLYDSVVVCPVCRKEDARNPNVLPFASQCHPNDVVHYNPEKLETALNETSDVAAVTAELFKCRWQTVRILQGVADEIADHLHRGGIAKVAGSATAVAGTGVAVLGFILTFTGVGAFAGSLTMLDTSKLSVNRILVDGLIFRFTQEVYA